jgi:hypothetical protein
MVSLGAESTFRRSGGGGLTVKNSQSITIELPNEPKMTNRAKRIYKAIPLINRSMAVSNT